MNIKNKLDHSWIHRMLKFLNLREQKVVKYLLKIHFKPTIVHEINKQNKFITYFKARTFTRESYFNEKLRDQ